MLIDSILFTTKILTCFQVGWVKADTKAIQAIHEHVITHNPRISVSHNDHTTWNLHIRSVQEEDRGQYMCQINTDPMKSQVSKTRQAGLTAPRSSLSTEKVVTGVDGAT